MDQSTDGDGDDNSVETEEQAAERASKCGSDQVEVGSHRSLVLAVPPILHSDCGVSKPARQERAVELAGKSIEHQAHRKEHSFPSMESYLRELNTDGELTFNATVAGRDGEDAAAVFA